jgi:hypothetical protein
MGKETNFYRQRNTPARVRIHFVLFQSTSPYGRERYDGKSAQTLAHVSIHAPIPAPRHSCGLLRCHVSTHAPLRARTEQRSFQHHHDRVSIHAPVWREPVSSWCGVQAQSFNPRARMAADAYGEYRRVENFLFQSTHPYGREPATIDTNAGGLRFQSTRSARARTTVSLHQYSSVYLFQSTRRGANPSIRSGKGCFYRHHF